MVESAHTLMQESLGGFCLVFLDWRYRLFSVRAIKTGENMQGYNGMVPLQKHIAGQNDIEKCHNC